MKTLILKRDMMGKSAKVSAQNTYETTFGQWVAEVDGEEMDHACDLLCEGITDCSCENLHAQADQDDDGKEYRIKSV